VIAAFSEWGLRFCALLLALLLALVPHAVAPLAAIAGLCAAGIVAANPPYRFAALRVPAACLAALLLWGLASALWSIEPQRSLILDLRLAALFVAALALAAAAERIAAPQRVAMFLLAGLGLGLAVTWFELATGGELINRISVRGFEPYRLDQITIGLAILAPPVAAWLVQRGRPALAVIAAAAMVGTIAFLDDTTAKAALVASLPMIALLYW